MESFCPQKAGCSWSYRQAFARFFHRCLDAGVYLAPSQFETGFISLAHTEADIEETVRIAAGALRAG